MPNEPDDYTDEEASRRADEVVKRMLATPPKPRKVRSAPEPEGEQPKPRAG